MGYMMDLDEYSETALQAELARRAAARSAGNCDYCGGIAGKSSRETMLIRMAAGVKGYETCDPMKYSPSRACRFPARHGVVIPMPGHEEPSNES